MRYFTWLDFLVALMLSFVLCGCSEDASPEDILSDEQTYLKEVDSVKDLPECTSKNEGTQIRVKGEFSARICVDSKWYAILNNDEVSAECTMEKLKGKSGFKVVCNGDSVGVVLNENDSKVQNGKNGIDGTDGENGNNCSVKKVDDESAWVVCGSDSTLFHWGENDSLIDSGNVELDSECVAVSVDEISGTSQKGPLLKGSKVVLRELQDGRSLAQTGNSFNGKILNDKGDFKINAQRLTSQYVVLEATGYYRNEVTGKNSNSELTLYSLSNVLQKRTVNVNLLTHLEYERVLYLVTKKKYSVKKAKKQAQVEILNLFGIDATKFSNSENLSIAGASEEDAALLAFSILLQGDRSVADLSTLLQKISTDMEKDGVWDGAETRISMADWCADADSAGLLDSIRRNVKSWNLSDTVPDFERYIRHFWYTEYGLDSCTAEQLGRVAKVSFGKHKNTKTRYVCADSSTDQEYPDYRWRVAGDMEKDTVGWKDSTDGAIRAGNVTGLIYVFDSTGVLNGNRGWRLAEDLEKMFGGGCGANRFGEIRRDTTESVNWIYKFYRCDSTYKWNELVTYIPQNQFLIDTQRWEDAENGTVRWGDSIGVVSAASRSSSGDFADSSRRCYVYDTSYSYKGWRMGSNEDCLLGLGGCTVADANKILQSSYDNRFYKCVYRWTQLTDKAEYNTVGYACDEEGKTMMGIIDKKTMFVCDGGKWRDARPSEELSGLICTKGLRGTFNEDSTMVCDTSSFRPVNMYDFDVGVRNYFNPDKSYGTLTDERDGQTYVTIRIGGKNWMAENLRFVDSTQYPYLKGGTFCHHDKEVNCQKSGRFYTWTAAMDLDSKWNSETTPTGMVTYPHRGICPKGWHIPTYTEFTDLGSYATLQAKNNSGWPYATNSSGFTALPAGCHYSSENYDGRRVRTASGIGSQACFITATEYGTNSLYSTSYKMNLSKNSRTFSTNDSKWAVSSVRCVEDDTPVNPEELDSVMIDPRDSSVYKIVVIGKQVWMAENMRYTDSTITSRCHTDADTCAMFGRFYNWSTAMNICLEGWRLPTQSDWTTLNTTIGGTPYAMQAKGFEAWPNATDAYGFTALPASIDGYTSFYGLPNNSVTLFWSSSEYDTNHAYYWKLYPEKSELDHYWDKSMYFSVRCIRN